MSVITVCEHCGKVVEWGEGGITSMDEIVCDECFRAYLDECDEKARNENGGEIIEKDPWL